MNLYRDFLRPLVRPGLACTLLVGSLSFAADSLQRRELEARSREFGLGVPSAPLLKRESGPGMHLMMEDLMYRFSKSLGPITTQGEASVLEEEDRLRVVGSGWYLQVYGDGTAVRYRNDAYLDGPNNPGIPVDARMPVEELEKLGREFIDTQLEGIIRLGEGEQLVPLNSQYQIDSGQEEGSSLIESAVTAQAIIFTRAVDGLHLLGPGSKVMVMFSAKGEPVGFDFDWAPYARSGEVQEVLPLEEIQERSKRIGPVPQEGLNVSLERFECGYFDPGVRRRWPESPVQTACYQHLSGSQLVDPEANMKNPEDGMMRFALAQPVPAGVEIAPDPYWSEAIALCPAGDPCSYSQRKEEPPPGDPL